MQAVVKELPIALPLNFFKAYYATTHQIDTPETTDILNSITRQFPSNSHVQLLQAMYHYSRREFEVAAELFQNYYDGFGGSCIDCVDIYSNILYLNEDAVSLSLLAQRCLLVDKYRPETCCVMGILLHHHYTQLIFISSELLCVKV